MEIARALARTMVRKHIASQLGAGESANIGVNITRFDDLGTGWSADLTSDAHTDKVYRVAYNSDKGRAVLEEFTKTDEQRKYDRQEIIVNPEPTIENAPSRTWGWQVGDGDTQYYHTFG